MQIINNQLPLRRAMSESVNDYATYITYALLLIAFAFAVWFIIKKGRENVAAAKEDAAPKVAGQDTLEGGAQNPEIFDEPDDDALDEMGALLGEEDDQENED